MDKKCEGRKEELTIHKGRNMDRKLKKREENTLKDSEG
jgi:hypothetical protein